MTRRLAATMAIDLRRQVTEGFWLVTVVVALLVASVLRAFDVGWATFWPLIVLADLTVTAFYFAAIQVLMQRSEGTLGAQVVTPLRAWEYLLCLAGSLGILSLVEMSVLVLIGFGWRLNWPVYLAAVGITAFLYVTYGFIAVSRYRSITQFLLPSGAWTAGFAIPMLPIFGFPTGWWMWLHPLQPVVALIQVAFDDREALWIAPALGAALVWMAVGFKLATARYHRFAAGRYGWS